MKVGLFASTDSNYTKPHYSYSVKRSLGIIIPRIRPDFSIFNGFNIQAKTIPREEYGRHEDFMDANEYNFFAQPGTGDNSEQFKEVLKDRMLSDKPTLSGIPGFPNMFGFSKAPTNEQIEQIIIKLIEESGKYTEEFQANYNFSRPPTREQLEKLVKEQSFFTVFSTFDTYSEEFEYLKNNFLFFGDALKLDGKNRVEYPKVKKDRNGNIITNGLSSGFPSKKSMDELDKNEKKQAPYTNALACFNEKGELEKIEFYQLKPSEKLKLIQTYFFLEDRTEGDSKDFTDFREYDLAKKRYFKKGQKTIEMGAYETLQSLLEGAAERNEKLVTENERLKKAIKKKGLKTTPHKKDELALTEIHQPGFLKKASKKVLSYLILTAAITIPSVLVYFESKEIETDLLNQDNKYLRLIRENQRIRLDEQKHKLIIKGKEITGLKSKNTKLADLVTGEREQKSKLRIKLSSKTEELEGLSTKLRNTNKTLEGQTKSLTASQTEILRLKDVIKSAPDPKQFEEQLQAKQIEYQKLQEQFNETQAHIKEQEQELIQARELSGQKDKTISDLEKQLTFAPTKTPEIGLKFLKTLTRKDVADKFDIPESVGKFDEVLLYERLAVFLREKQIIKTYWQESVLELLKK